MPDGKYLTFNGNPYHQLSQLCKLTDIQPIISNYGALRQIQGSFQLNRKVSSNNIIINLGSTPECLFVGYDMDVRTYGMSERAHSEDIPMVVLRNHINTNPLYQGDLIIKIVQNGFSYAYGGGRDYTDIITLNYISFYIA